MPEPTVPYHEQCSAYSKSRYVNGIGNCSALDGKIIDPRECGPRCACFPENIKPEYKQAQIDETFIRR